MNPDVATANVFDAPRGWTPGGTDQVNTLNDDDVLTGKGENPTLNVDFVDDADFGATTITPELRGIETINVNALGTANKTLDLQDASGVDSLNVSRINSAAFTFANIADAVGSMSVNNTQANANVSFNFLNSALSGAEDEAEVTLNNVDIGTLRIQAPGEGYETLTMNSVGSDNEVDLLQAEDLQTLTIVGDQDLRLGASNSITSGAGARVEATQFIAGLANVVGSLDTIDASGLAGNIQIHLGAELVATYDGTSGVPVDFQYLGGTGDDHVVVLNGLNANDVLDLGEGDNSVTVLATTRAGTIENAQSLNVLNQAGAANTIGVDAGIVSGLESVFVRNEGQAALASTPSPLTANIVNLAAEPASDVTVLHGTTGNNGLAQNTVQLDMATGITEVTVKLADGVNSNDRFNLNLYTDSDLVLNAAGAVASGQNNAGGVNAVTTLNLVDGDTESNTVALTAQGYTAAGGLRADDATSYTTINVSGGQAGKFLNLDSASVTGNGFGVVTNGNTGNAASGLAATQLDTVFANVYAGTTYAAAAAGVGYVLAGATTAAASRAIATTINAAEYEGDVVLRVGQADQSITTGSGNDTIIFDAINDTRAGLTIADKVIGGEGVDTIVIDGGSTVGATNIVLGASEWTNLSGIDVLRLGSNNGGGNYTLSITDQLISQTDNGDRITIINNDGDLSAVTASAAVIDARQSNGLSATKAIDFYGENGDSVNGLVANPNNRIILSDATANGSHVLNGGDRDVQTFPTTAGWGGSTQGNNNTIEYRNTSVVTEGDQVGISNFATIAFNNDLAVAQTLTLELTTAVADRLADASHVATAQAQESLTITANDGSVPAPLAGAALNVSAQTVSNAFQLTVTSDNVNAVVDQINLNDNVGGTGGHTVNIADGGAAADVLTFYGATGNLWSAVANVITVSGTQNTGNLTFQNATGLATVDHAVSWDNVDVIRLTNDNGATFTTLANSATNLAFNGGAGGDTIIGTAGNNVINGGAGNDTITGGAGADTLTGGTGNDTFVFAGTVASADLGNTITDFGTGTNIIDFTTNAAAGTGITAGNFQAAAVAVGGGAVAAVGGFAMVTDAGGNTAVDLTTANVAAFLADVDGAAGSSFTFTNADNVLYLAVTDGTDLGIYIADDQNADTVIDAGDLTQVITLQGVTTIAAADLADFV